MWQVIGQERAVSLLQHGLEAGKLAHAYLFVGPAHVGKMTLALNLAQALNCEAAGAPLPEVPCLPQDSRGRHADVQVIGLLQNEDEAEAKLISIEQIKDMQHAANLPPSKGNARSLSSTVPSCSRWRRPTAC